LLFYEYGKEGQTAPLNEFDPLLKKHQKKVQIQYFMELDNLKKVLSMLDKHLDVKIMTLMRKNFADWIKWNGLESDHALNYVEYMNLIKDLFHKCSIKDIKRRTNNNSSQAQEQSSSLTKSNISSRPSGIIATNLQPVETSKWEKISPHGILSPKDR